jgi:7,8-dihydropterin-6-yl-methyl-4-(beta-D-ribofuranosyl)aminobenzene 5'-phosphate synthase
MPAENSPVTVVYDNVSLREELEPGWGFSCLLDLPQGCVLFDTGAEPEGLLRNLARMGFDPRRIRHVVLSHAHEDHCGGLGGVLAVNSRLSVYVPASFPPRFADLVESRGARCERVDKERTLLPGVHTTGEIGGGIPEQALVVETERGLVVVTGCAHPGIVEVVTRAVDRFRGRVRLLLGGFHLVHHEPSVIREIAERLEALGVDRIAPCHCTGDRAREIMEAHFGERCARCGAGLELTV